MEIEVIRDDVNSALLDADLRAALKEKVYGISVTNGRVRVHLDPAASKAEQAQAEALVKNHKATDKTPAQVAEQAQAQKLDQMRKDYGSGDLALASFDAQTPVLKQLAQKIAWLEAEVRALRGR